MLLNLTLIATNLVLYVSNSGSDTNCGLSADKPFQTIQHAVDVATTDYKPAANGVITIQVADGTYSGATLWNGGGPGSYELVGDTSSPSNVVLTNGPAPLLYIPDSANWLVDGFTFQSTANLDAISCGFNGDVSFQDVVFGSGLGTDLYAWEGGRITALSNYTIAGGGLRHMFATTGGSIQIAGVTVTVTGTPNFSSTFALANAGGVIQAAGTTFSGSATGIRYIAGINGTFYVGGAGVNLFPGNVAGYTEYGGQYQ